MDDDDDDVSRMSDGIGGFQDSAVIDSGNLGTGKVRSQIVRSPAATKTRSLSDGGGTPTLSPSPQIFKSARPQSKDDIGIRDKESKSKQESSLPGIPALPVVPSTPTRAGFPIRALALQLPPRETCSPAQQSTSKHGHAAAAERLGFAGRRLTSDGSLAARKARSPFSSNRGSQPTAGRRSKRRR